METNRLNEFKTRLRALLEEYGIPRYFVSVETDGIGEVGFTWGKGMSFEKEG